MAEVTSGDVTVIILSPEETESLIVALEEGVQSLMLNTWTPVDSPDHVGIARNVLDGICG